MNQSTASTHGRWALVSGGSGGIGGAIAVLLAQDGWNVAVTYRGNGAAAAEVVDEIRAAGREASSHQVDLRDAAAAAAVVDAVAEDRQLGAAISAAGPSIVMEYLARLEPEVFAQTIDADLIGCFNLFRPALPHLRVTAGSVLAVTTAAVDRAARKDVLSSAPKAGVEAVVKAIAVEEGRYGTRANCVAVGLLEGDGMWADLVARGDYTEEFLKTAKSNIPLGRFGTVRDIAHAALFLLSNRANWITGQTLRVDGGFSA